MIKQQHREKEQQLNKHVSALDLVGAAEGALVFEDDPSAEESCRDLLSICTTGLGIPEGAREGITDAMLCSGQDEAKGFEAAGTWDLLSVREYADVKAEAMRSGISRGFW